MEMVYGEMEIECLEVHVLDVDTNDTSASHKYLFNYIIFNINSIKLIIF